MATKKPLKAAKPVAKKQLQPVKKQTQAKIAVSVSKTAKAKTPVKKVAAKVAKPAQAVKPVAKKAKPVVKAKTVVKAKPVVKAKTVVKAVSKVVAKVVKASKQAVKVVAPKKAAKPAASKTKVPVKKAIENKKEIKAATPVKKAAVVPEKKATAKATPAPVAPIPKKAEVKKAAAKPEVKEVKPDPAKPAPVVKAAAPVKKAEPKPAKPVVIPKTSTDKKVDYQPDFMKSVLDTPVYVSQGPTMRYSDAELQEFRDLINKKLDAAKKELAYLQGLITRRDEMGGDETDNRYMTMEDGGMSMEREQLSQMASRQITFIDHLEKAIMRIENKTYGICRVTGKLIDKARLRAVPHATLSMEAKLGIVK